MQCVGIPFSYTPSKIYLQDVPFAILSPFHHLCFYYLYQPLNSCCIFEVMVEGSGRTVALGYVFVYKVIINYQLNPVVCGAS